MGQGVARRTGERIPLRLIADVPGDRQPPLGKGMPVNGLLGHFQEIVSAGEARRLGGLRPAI